MSKHNRMANATTTTSARQMYHNIGLCYDCGIPFKKCECKNPEWINSGPDDYLDLRKTQEDALQIGLQ